MLLLNQILLSHRFNGIIFFVLRIQAEHDLSESPFAQDLQQLKFLKAVHRIVGTLVFKDQF